MDALRRIKPPFWLLASALAMLLLHRYLPGRQLVGPPVTRAGIGLMVVGLALTTWGAGLFRRSGTPVVPFTRSTTLVTTGPYRFTRNPMYLGMIIALAGLGLLLGSLTPLVVIPAFAILIHSAFVLAEERLLLERFGAEYEALCARVGRWL